MTGQPEAAIARELALCYTAISMVTDSDAGVGGGDLVSQADVMRTFGANLARLKDLLRAAVRELPEPEDDDVATCPCRRSLDGLVLPFELP
jgi:5'-methylthioadenosine phosphorylase